jgi:hypothetical protein
MFAGASRYSARWIHPGESHLRVVLLRKNRPGAAALPSSAWTIIVGLSQNSFEDVPAGTGRFDSTMATVAERDRTIRSRFAAALIVAAVAFASASAQQHPDFSGHWVLVSATSDSTDVPRSLVVQQPLTRTTAPGAPGPQHVIDLSRPCHRRATFFRFHR